MSRRDVDNPSPTPSADAFATPRSGTPQFTDEDHDAADYNNEEVEANQAAMAAGPGPQEVTAAEAATIYLDKYRVAAEPQNWQAEFDMPMIRRNGDIPSPTLPADAFATPLAAFAAVGGGLWSGPPPVENPDAVDNEEEVEASLADDPAPQQVVMVPQVVT